MIIKTKRKLNAGLIIASVLFLIMMLFSFIGFISYLVGWIPYFYEVETIVILTIISPFFETLFLLLFGLYILTSYRSNGSVLPAFAFSSLTICSFIAIASQIWNLLYDLMSNDLADVISISSVFWIIFNIIEFIIIILLMIFVCSKKRVSTIVTASLFAVISVFYGVVQLLSLINYNQVITPYQMMSYLFDAIIGLAVLLFAIFAFKEREVYTVKIPQVRANPLPMQNFQNAYQPQPTAEKTNDNTQISDQLQMLDKMYLDGQITFENYKIVKAQLTENKNES